MSKPRPAADSPRPPARPRAKLKDVAEACEVSIGTVSRVLNGDPSFSVRHAVREKIIETAAKLGYAPNLAARSLHAGATQIIGVFGSPDTHIGEGINDKLLGGIVEGVRGFDYEVFYELTSHHSQSRPLPFWQFDGAILIQSPSGDLVGALNARQTPFVSVNEITEGARASVIADDVGGTVLAVDHLAGLGHRRIAYANVLSGYFPHYSTQERHDTLVARCAHHGVALVDGHDAFFSEGLAYLRHAVVERAATAVVAYDHRIAIDILGAASRLKLRIPEDFSLLCFNDEFPVAAVYPPFTVVAVSGREMGIEAARALMRGVEGQRPESAPVRVPERLIVRESTAPPRS